jgi:zinc protease
MSDPAGPPSSDPGDQQTFLFERPLLPAGLTARYDVTGRLGAGGMGVVYMARDRVTGATVALKVIHPDIAGRSEAVERFIAELLLARQITHKNVCRVYDLNRFDDVVVIAMEYVAGERLRDVMQRKGRLPIGEALPMVRQLIAGLREAHAQGIVHRDIKPENILIAPDGTVKVMDFGLARSTDSTHTMSGAVMGTPAYMAPEQAEGRAVDRRTDIYALGLVLYEMLTGAATFSGETAVTVALKQIREAPVPPATLEPTIPPAIERAILQCLEKDPAKRFQSVDELEQALSGSGMETAPPARPEPARPRVSRRTVALVTAGVALLVLIAAIATAVLRRPASINIPFQEFTLANGLRVILSEDHSAPTLTMAVTYDVGSRDERPGKTGYAHLFEHMMFQGSANVGKGEHTMLVQSNGGQANGTTNPDNTLYYDTLPANQLDLVLFLEADRMRSLAIDESNLENQRSTVLQERAFTLDNQPYGKSQVALMETPYDSFGYRHPTIGSIEDLKAATVNDLKEFFKTYYAPNNAVVTLVGDLKTDEALAKITKYFGDIPAQPKPPAPDLTEGEPRAERRLVVEDPFVTTPRVDVAYKISPADTPDWYALSVASSILGFGQSSRLYQKLVKETEVAVSSSGGTLDRRGPSLMMFSVVPRPGKDTKQIEKLIYEEIERLKNEPVRPEELERIRLHARRQFAQQFYSTLARAVTLGTFATSYKRPDLINTIPRTLDRLSADDLKRVARAYLTESRRSVVVTVPKAGSASAPAPAQATQPAEDKSVPLGRVERKQRAPVSSDVLRLKLPVSAETVLDNGLGVVVLENHRLPAVAVLLNISGAGGVDDPPELPGLASITAQMLNQGTKTRSSKQLAEEIGNLGATLSVSAGFGSSATIVRADGLSDNFDAWLALVVDVLLHPTFPVDELNGLKQRTKAQVQQGRASPSFLANERFARVLFGDHPAHVVSPTAQALDAMTSDTLSKWYTETYVPQNTLLSVVGDVNASRVIGTLKEQLGGWRKTGRQETVAAKPPPAAATRISLVDRPNSAQTTLMLGSIAIDRRDPDYIPLIVMNQIIGGDASSRLFTNLREQRGYTSSAGATLTALKYPGPWRVSTDVRVDATEDAVRQILLEIRRLRDEPVPPAELEDAKRSLASRFALSLESPGQVLTYLSTRRIYGFSAGYWDSYPAKIMEVSAEEVQRVAQKYINPDALVIVAVGDRQKIESALARFGPVELFDTEGRQIK